MSTRVGVVVGRFQVHDLHTAHLQLIQAVRKSNQRVIVFVGVPRVLASKRNPLDYVTRKKMLEAEFPWLTVAPLPDQPSDEAWSRELDRRIREISPMGKVTLYGGRDSFLPHYSGQFATEEMPSLGEVSGATSRAKMGAYAIESREFRHGVIYATQNRFPVSYQAVDIAIEDEANPGFFWLGGKIGDELLRFPGGFVDPTDISLEAAARREAREETNLDVSIGRYLGSFRIDDWRYRREDDKIMSAFFLAKNGVGVAKAGDDLARGGWCSLARLKETDIIPEHRPLFTRLLQHFPPKGPAK